MRARKSLEQAYAMDGASWLEVEDYQTEVALKKAERRRWTV
jgi:hypothetical protein